ncbi:type VI secretion system-associated protein TagF [Oxalobacteraceae bacterium OTU3CINTB1]|nr:type VI secretion system-associated protein TagF [Oxalobacteraceae bacterium OTU3CINTB1]
MAWENNVERTGFFGKVTSHGDFVTRRLAPEFQQPWDAWLQAGLQHSKAALGTGWLATYLSSPIWRFALAPGVCGVQAQAGLLMPSVDRVGRHFPLTLARALDTATPLADCVTAHHRWYAELESLALSSLEEDFSLDAFDAAVEALAPPPALAGAPGTTVVALDGIAPPALAQTRADGGGVVAAIAAAALSGHCLWWTDGSPQVAPCLVLSRGLPPAGAFAALLDGDWRGHGWPGA